MQKLALLGSSYDVVGESLRHDMMCAAQQTRGFDILYCGTASGILSELATYLLDLGARVTGYLCPEYAHDVKPDLSATKSFQNYSTRQQALVEDACLILLLPGGFGTAVELFQLLNKSQKGQLDKRVILCNFQGYWGGALKQIHAMKSFGAIKNFELEVVASPEELGGALEDE